MSALTLQPGKNIKLLERVGARVIISMSADTYERLIEDLEMDQSREKLIKRYHASAKSKVAFSV